MTNKPKKLSLSTLLYYAGVVVCVMGVTGVTSVTGTGCATRTSRQETDVRMQQATKGDSILANGAYWKALPFYRYAWALSETDQERTEISAKLYQLFYQAREWDSCVLQAETVRGTIWFDSLKHKGLVYWRTGNMDEVLAISDASILLRAEAALRLGNNDSAWTLYRQAESELGDVASGRLAEVYAELGFKDSAAVLLLKMDNPSRTQRTLLVNILFEQQEYGKLPGVIARMDNKTDRLSSLIRLYDITGDDIKMRRTQVELLKISPSSWTARQAAKQLTPRNAYEIFLTAKAYYYMDKDISLELFSKAQAQGYSSTKCRWERGSILYKQKKYQDAYDVLKGLKSTDARFLYVKAALKLGKTTEAMQVLADVAENATSKKDRQEAWERQATILQRQGKNLEAAELAALGAQKLADEELGHRALVLWLAEGDSVNTRKALAGQIPVDWDVAIFFRTWLSPDSADILLTHLESQNPFSYYSLAARKELAECPALDTWFIQLGDTSTTLNSRDSATTEHAWSLAEAGFFTQASSKLRSIKNPPLPLMYRWGKRFSELGADNITIHWMEMLLSKARKKSIYTRPLEVVKLQYPPVYAFEIIHETDDPAQFMALTRQESWFNPKAKSSANAYGLCQLLLSTARGMDTTVTVDSLYLPRVSIKLGAEFYHRMRNRFDDRKAAYLGAYNAGPGAVNRWLEYLPEDDILFTELIPYDETRGYVKQIGRGEVIYRNLLGLIDEVVTDSINPGEEF